MDHFQCSEDAANRLRATVQGLLEEPPNPPPVQPLNSPLPDLPIPPKNEEPQPPTRKKVIFPDFDLNTTVADRIPHAPSQYAVGKIENMEYVELWYFTTEGCREASKATPTAADDTFCILNTDTGLTLQSFKVTRASRNAIADEHLSWEQIMTARHNLIATADRGGWPKKHTLALAQLYIDLEDHKAAGYNPRALILYHAIVRKQWHDAMRGRGTPFNPSRFNENLFIGVVNQIRDRDQEELQRMASKMLSP